MTVTTRARRSAAGRLLATVQFILMSLPLGVIAAPADLPPDGPRRCDSEGNDQRTAEAILMRLRWDTSLDATDMTVEVLNGRVELRGLARSEDHRTRAGSLALDIYGTTSLSNQIDVNDWAPRTETARRENELRARTRLERATQSDRSLSSAIGNLLSHSRAVGSCGIAIEVIDGTANLGGSVASASSRKAAITLTESTLGVRSVHAADLAVN